jgi:acyl-CoA synthetase (AMP-forming)/AMP-acid ligase II
MPRVNDTSDNVAETLRETARRFPAARGVVAPIGRNRNGTVRYRQLSFAQLDHESDCLAAGLIDLGVSPGDRLVLAVRPGIEFIALTYAVFRARGTLVLIDPGMGPRRVFGCLDQVEPAGFLGLPLVQALRRLNGRRFAQAKSNVTVGAPGWWPRWLSGTTYQDLCDRGARVLASAGPTWQWPATRRTDPAAIIFTSGSTGPPKGVVYEHGMFRAQVDLLREFYGLEPGGADVPGFPLFGLFNAALGVTTVIPDMDASRPARVDPRRILEAIELNQATQGFGSPAIWNRVGNYCAERQITLPTLRRVFSAGAPVPERVLRQMSATLTQPGASMHTPYGATEALPVASISAREVLDETVTATRQGAGTCVGRLFPQMELRIIAITDDPLPHWSGVRELPPGEIGEIVVRGPVVTREYFALPQATALAKITDGDTFWHRMGDVGYLDSQGRLWFCGRKSQRVVTVTGPLFTDQIEPVFNTHPQVFRSALVGVGPRLGQRPVLVVELAEGARWSPVLQQRLLDLGASVTTTRDVQTILPHPGPLPVDVRHNTKLNREALAVWASQRVATVDT